MKLLVPKDGGVGLSYLGLTGCNEISSSFLLEISPLFIFSDFVESNNFVGFRPSPAESTVRMQAKNKKQRLDGAKLIQRVARGLMVRNGVYQEMKEEWTSKFSFRRTKKLAHMNNPTYIYAQTHIVSNMISLVFSISLIIWHSSLS